VSKEDEKPVEGADKADPKDKDVKAAKPEAPEAEDKDPGDEATPGGTDDPAKPKKPHWSQKRIDELTYSRRSAERDRDYWRELAIKNAQQPAQPAQQQTPAANKPAPAQFTTTEDYLEALADWKSEQKLQDWDRKRRESAEKEQREQAAQKVHKTFAEREQKAREKYEDFEEVAYHLAPINEVMAEVIRRSEFGPEIAYFLGKNPDRGQQIAQMTDPHSVALAIGRIEAQLDAQANPAPAVTSTPKAAPTTAPPPPKTLSGSAPVQKSPEEMTTKEWVDWRNSQVRKKRA